MTRVTVLTPDVASPCEQRLADLVRSAYMPLCSAGRPATAIYQGDLSGALQLGLRLMQDEAEPHLLCIVASQAHKPANAAYHAQVLTANPQRYVIVIPAADCPGLTDHLASLDRVRILKPNELLDPERASRGVANWALGQQ